ncbi:MAG TPA: fibronectin/fibrinogen-binding protein [Clostridiaceae bacterium]|nr:fibronectin/fibrinogen-binding protein [Clostridiaceae bacterium]
MPFDGIVTKCVVNELKDKIIDGRIEKIFQPESDEILINIRAKGRNYKLVLSANASYPRIHLVRESKENPSAPPMFCMLLRKYLSNGRIIDIGFHDYERIVTISVESANEMGDLSEKKLIIEIMGRHSNIILINNQNKIIDAIKHVDAEISSVREVMPAREYILPPSQNKLSPDAIRSENFLNYFLGIHLNGPEHLESSDETTLPAYKNTMPVDVDSVFSGITSVSAEKYLLNNIKGFSPLLCREICHRAGIFEKTSMASLSNTELINLKEALSGLLTEISEGKFSPCIIYDNTYGSDSYKKPIDFHCVKMTQYSHVEYLSSISEALDNFYTQKDAAERLRQKKSELYKVLHNSIERCNKKISLQQEKLRDVSDREKLKLYGELLTANIYNIPSGVDKVALNNYYSENWDMIEIPLDPNLSPQQNAQKYYKQYAKAKSTYINTSKQLEESLSELDYLESVSIMLENCSSLQEIDEIRQELIEQGYLVSGRKNKYSLNKKDNPSRPMHFVSSDGLDIYVGKNNKQNEILTLKTSSSKDIWLHAKNIPGSHVIIKHTGRNIPDKTLEEAAMLAAYYSKASSSSNVPVDYTTVKNVKKPKGLKPGMVIYENYKTIIVNPGKPEGLRLYK